MDEKQRADLERMLYQMPTDQQQKSWERMAKCFRDHFLREANAGFVDDFNELDWWDIPPNIRGRLIDAIRENPRFGWQFGLEPVRGFYVTSVGNFTVEEAKAGYDENGKPKPKKKAKQPPRQSRKAGRVVLFSDYRSSDCDRRQGTKHRTRNL